MSKNLILRITCLFAMVLFMGVTDVGVSWADFSYVIRNPKLKSAEQYVVSRSNISVRTEGDSTYLCPEKGAATLAASPPGVVVYHFSFADPISEASLFVRTDTFHWKYSQGHSYVYASVNGRSWIKLAEAPPPEYGKWRSGNASCSLPAVFIGKKDIYVKVELYSYGPSASSGGAWCNTAQHLRYDKNSDNVTFQLEVKNAGAPTADFSAEVNGVDVSFDWSAMVAADSYTLAVALSDNVGNVDMGTLKFLDMGTRRTFSTTGLPSGMIFYVAILAYTDQGLVVSDMVKVMPFSGTVTYFNSNGVLLQVADPGGIGNFTVSGHFDGDIAYLTQISGDDGSGPFTLKLVNEKPAVYTKGDFVLNFTYDAAGNIGTQRTARRTVSLSVSECQNMINDKISKLTEDWIRDYLELGRIKLVLEAIDDISVLDNQASFEFNANPEQKISAKDGMWNIFGYLQAAVEGRYMTYKEDLAKLEKQLDDCTDDPVDPVDPVGPVGPHTPVIRDIEKLLKGITDDFDDLFAKYNKCPATANQPDFKKLRIDLGAGTLYCGYINGIRKDFQIDLKLAGGAWARFSATYNNDGSVTAVYQTHENTLRATFFGAKCTFVQLYDQEALYHEYILRFVNPQDPNSDIIFEQNIILDVGGKSDYRATYDSSYNLKAFCKFNDNGKGYAWCEDY